MLYMLFIIHFSGCEKFNLKSEEQHTLVKTFIGEEKTCKKKKKSAENEAAQLKQSLIF